MSRALTGMGCAIQPTPQDVVGNDPREIDIKNYAKIEKIPGGTIEECKVRLGVLDILKTGAWVCRGWVREGGGIIKVGHNCHHGEAWCCSRTVSWVIVRQLRD